MLEAEASMQPYPITQPISIEVRNKFSTSLTFFHECAHFSQFISSSFGLRTLRYTLICLRNLSTKRGWPLPIFQNLHSRLESLSEDEKTMYGHCFMLADAMDQLSISQNFDPLKKCLSGLTVSVRMEPWSPHFSITPADRESIEKDEFIKFLVSIGAHIKKIPIIEVATEDGLAQIALNAASLMEAYAVVCELSHLQNALRCDLAEALNYLPEGNEYWAVILYVLQSGFCRLDTLLPTLSVCIDIALMYDPFILYDVPWDIVDEQGRGDCYPGETFVTVCNALPKLRPIESAEPAEIERFSKELCACVGLPSPTWMADKAFAVADNILKQLPWERALMGGALKAHRDALKIRRDIGASIFPIELITTGGLNRIVSRARQSIVFYNLHTKQPDIFVPRAIDCITVHSILMQAIFAPAIRCPLKFGTPFFCPTAASDPNHLCVWKLPDRKVECLVDILERQFGLSVE
ncbi:hypothetical protein [Methylosinus sp. LW4]|uniref:hypothetical protein n=1 Tax=Methylosinus sp. LW4 TaxID=136993 RepID=UPI0012F7BA00|nr:hypothetical protein [Methylosinus sp. LW4]